MWSSSFTNARTSVKSTMYNHSHGHSESIPATKATNNLGRYCDKNKVITKRISNSISWSKRKIPFKEVFLYSFII